MIPDKITLTLDEAEERLRFCSSYTRLPVLLSMAPPVVEPAVWYRLLGENWEMCDLITPLYLELLPWLNGKGTIREMMSEDEWLSFEHLPDVLTVYRGCYLNNARGVSWSLSKEVAMKFPTLHRYRQAGQSPILIEASVPKEEVIALKLGREEQEIITFNPRIISGRCIEELILDKSQKA